MKIKVYIKTNRYGSTCEETLEIDDAEWDEMTDEGREAVARDAAFEMMEWGYEVL